MSAFHKSIMLPEIIGLQQPSAGKRYIDATLGGGGYTLALLEKGADVLAIDADNHAINFVGDLLKESELENRAKLIRGNFRDILQIAGKYNFSDVDGIIFDLGMSSYQIDQTKRGFSYKDESADLDMRFDQRDGITASNLLNQASREELYEIFIRYGEEKHSGTISDAISRARKIKPIVKVSDLNRIITDAAGQHPGTNKIRARIYQALRIAVNQELTALRSGLDGAYKLLKHKGCLTILSFHSLEDRTVKLFLQPDRFGEISKKPITATEAEIRDNPRANSAKLRFGKKA